MTQTRGTDITSDRTYPFLVSFLKVVTLAGMILSIFQFIYNRSLWHDEAALTLNILQKSWPGLFRPLDYLQAAPAGFLLIEKAVVSILGESEIALRLFPLICFLISIPLFYHLVKRLSGDQLAALISVAIFSVNPVLIRYATEVKQYIVDVAIALLILTIAIRSYHNIRTQILLLISVGVLSILFSHVSVITLFVAGMYLLFTAVYQKKRYAFILPIVTWLLVFLINYLFQSSDEELNAHMQRYWNDRFMPLYIFSNDSLRFWHDAGRSLFGFQPGFNQFWSLTFLLYVIGLCHLICSRRFIFLYVLASPVIVHVVISALRLYPFGGRLTLYLLPLIMTTYVMGMLYLFNTIRKHLVRLPSVMLAIPILLMCYSARRAFPIQVEEIKHSIRYVEQHFTPGDRVYVDFTSYRAFQYYQRTGVTSLDDEVIPGINHRRSVESFERELRELNGKVWVIVSHPIHLDSVNSSEKFALDTFTKHGGRIVLTHKAKGSNCYYIDTGR